jgi:hypothetical protein
MKKILNKFRKIGSSSTFAQVLPLYLESLGVSQEGSKRLISQLVESLYGKEAGADITPALTLGREEARDVDFLFREPAQIKSFLTAVKRMKEISKPTHQTVKALTNMIEWLINDRRKTRALYRLNDVLLRKRLRSLNTQVYHVIATGQVSRSLSKQIREKKIRGQAGLDKMIAKGEDIIDPQYLGT